MTENEISPAIRELLSEYGDWVLFERRLSEKTREVYLRDASRFVVFLSSKSIAIESAKSSDVEAFLIALREDEDIDQRTSSRLLSSLRSFFSFLSSRNIVDSNPAKLVQKPKEGEHLPRTISSDEIDQLLDAFNGSDPLAIRDYTLFELIYSTGMRISEAVMLSVSSYRSSDGTLSVIGKRNKQRIVQVGEIAKEAVDRYLTDSRPRLIGRKSEDALFLGRRGERLTRQAAHKRFHQIAGKVGLDATIHTLRHCFASHMIENGADIRSVQEMLGHSDVKTTQIYTHLDTRTLLASFDRYSPLGDDDE